MTDPLAPFDSAQGRPFDSAQGKRSSQTPLAPSAPDRFSGQELRVDRYHTGVRLTALALWFGVVVVFYFLGRLLLGLFNIEITGGTLLLLALGAILMTQPLARWGERELISRWPSGRVIRLESTTTVTLHEKSGAARIDLSQKVNFWRWKFVVRGRRGGRVPNGFYCMAVRLVQEDTAFSVYAFVPPKQSEALSARYNFYELRPSTDKGKPMLGGREAVYLAAERTRWTSGAELDPSDFEILLDHLAAALPDFAPAAVS
jgi:hypothetical protein